MLLSLECAGRHVDWTGYTIKLGEEFHCVGACTYANAAKNAPPAARCGRCARLRFVATNSRGLLQADFFSDEGNQVGRHIESDIRGRAPDGRMYSGWDEGQVEMCDALATASLCRNS